MRLFNVFSLKFIESKIYKKLFSPFKEKTPFRYLTKYSLIFYYRKDCRIKFQLCSNFINDMSMIFLLINISTFLKSLYRFFQVMIINYCALLLYYYYISIINVINYLLLLLTL